MRLQAGTGAHRARLQRNDKRAISEIPSVKRGGRFSHRLDFSVGKRIGMRLTQVPPAANHLSVSGKHDGTDRHLAIRGGFAGQRDRQFHIIVPSHTPQCSGGHTTAPHDWSARPTCMPDLRAQPKRHERQPMAKHAHNRLLVGWKRLGNMRKGGTLAVFELILCIIAAVVLSSFLSRFIPKVSTPLVQIALGALASQLPFFPDVTLDPELFMVLFIAPLLYLEAHEIDKTELLKSVKLSLSLAIGLAIATMVAVGFALHTVWPAIPLAAALALGAALGPTDAVAVSSLGKEAALTERQTSVLKGESLFNDASGIVGFQFAIAAAVSGVFEVGESAAQFVISFFGGAIFGLVVGTMADLLFESLRSLGWETTTSRILMELFLPFILYLGAEAVHVSGILSVVAAGLIIRFDRTGIGPNVARTNIVSSSVWGVLSFSLNGTVFILLGMLLPNAMSASWDDPHVSNQLLLVAILVVAAVVIVMRFLWISLMLRLARDTTTGKRRKMTAKRWRSAAVMTFGGPKGTITLSLMFTIPYTLAAGANFPMRDELIFIAAGVIVVTLLLANFLLPLLAPNRDKDTSTEMTEITIEVLRRTVEELSGRVTPDNRRAVLMVIDSYTKRITRLKQRTGEIDPQGYMQLQIDALNWEKEYHNS